MSRTTRGSLWVVVSVGMAVLVMLFLYVVVQTWQNGRETHVAVVEIRNSQQDGSPISLKLLDILGGLKSDASNTKAILHQLNDCLEPGGKCYAASKQNQSDVVGLILIQQACAAGYADLSDTARIEATQRCVATWIKTHTSTNGASTDAQP